MDQLNDNDKQRIKDKAIEISSDIDNYYLSCHEKGILLAEYATLYEREQQQYRTNYYENKIEMLNRTAAEQQKYFEAERNEIFRALQHATDQLKRLTAERSELRNKVIEECIAMFKPLHEHFPINKDELINVLNSVRNDKA